MKNELMTVSKLLEEKKSIEAKLAKLQSAREGLQDENGVSRYDGETKVMVSGYARSFKIEKEVMIDVIDKKIDLVLLELEPISKKLDAIELMLNS